MGRSSQTDALGLSGTTMYQKRHSGAGTDRVRGFRTLQEEQKRGEWHHSVHCPLQNKLERLARRVEVLFTKRLQVQRLTNA